MIDSEKAGKPKFAAVASKYAKAMTENVAQVPASTTEPVKITDMTNVEKKASAFVDSVTDSVDQTIKKRRHPAYKGTRIARTFKIHSDVDLWMHNVYEQEGIELQAQITKALKEWLDKYYSALNPNR